MTVLYFAWVRQKIGLGEEEFALPAQVCSIGDLVEFLRARGAGYADAFSEPGHLRAAINRSHVPFDAPLDDGDEVAFFPPVTGG